MKSLNAIETNFEVLEDNGGGLHLAVFDGNEVIGFYSGFEIGGYLVESINALDEGTQGWDGNAENPQEAYDVMTSYQYGWDLVADNNGIYPDVMGHAAMLAFDVERD